MARWRLPWEHPPVRPATARALLRLLAAGAPGLSAAGCGSSPCTAPAAAGSRGGTGGNRPSRAGGGRMHAHPRGAGVPRPRGRFRGFQSRRVLGDPSAVGRARSTCRPLMAAAALRTAAGTNGGNG